MIARLPFLLLLFLTFLASACFQKQEGSIEGSVSPAAASTRIAVLQNNNEVMNVPIGAQDGKFRISLTAGMYAIKVIAADAPYPVHVNGIEVRKGRTTTLPPIEFMTRKGSAMLSGRIFPPRPDADITLVYEGRERASMHPDQTGNYEMKELPAGRYEVQINTPGHAGASTQVVAADGQKIVQNTLLFPIAPIDGVDWTTGKIHATGIGLPPLDAPSAPVARELAKRAALADAQRNMLRTIEQIRLNADQSVKTAMNNPNVALRVQGFLKGYTVIREQELDGGKFEVVLELPLYGPAGLSRFITENAE